LSLRPDPFLAVAISGGGTRAAAFGAGVMQELCRWRRDGVPLIRHVALLSTVSGGSIAGGWWCVHQPAKADDVVPFILGFCAKDHKGPLLGGLALPHRWWDYATQRSEVFADYLERVLYGGRAPRLSELEVSPLWLCNATDVDSGRPFVVESRHLGWIGVAPEDISVARATAASAAFPILTNPITLANRGTDVSPPAWVEPALGGGAIPDIGLRRRAEDWRRYATSGGSSWVHLVDGGLADNTGVRNMLRRLALPPDEASPGQSLYQSVMRSPHGPRRLALIAVNAGTPGLTGASRKQRGPSGWAVLKAAAKSSMNLRSDESMDLLDEWLRSFATRAAESPSKLRVKRGPGLAWNLGGKRVGFAIGLSFDHVQDSNLRARLKAVDTDYWPTREEVLALVKAGSALLRKDKDFLGLCCSAGFKLGED